jgi:hypothetical protein
MQSMTHAPCGFHQSMTDIAKILAQGSCASRKAGALTRYPVRMRRMKRQAKRPGRLHQKRLDSSLRSSVHAEKTSRRWKPEAAHWAEENLNQGDRYGYQDISSDPGTFPDDGWRTARNLS